MEIDVSRRFGFYIWKVLVPLFLLVAISWAVFWMIGDDLADRMSVSVTGILTVVAYQFIILDNLPRVSYFTLMDTVVTLSFGLMILTIVENVVVNVLYLQEQEDLAKKSTLLAAGPFRSRISPVWGSWGGSICCNSVRHNW